MRLLPVLLLLPPGLAAQCCLGAQDLEAVSDNGRYRVQARSLTGTGPEVHGPYRFEFRFQEHGPAGDWQTVSRFERSWNNKHHFSMQAFVSSSGNGFLLVTSLEPAIVFYGRDGTRLREITGRPGMQLGLERYDEKGLFRTIRALEDVDRRRWHTRSVRLFLPLGAPVPPERRRQPGAEWEEAPADDLAFGRDVEGETWLRRMLHWDPSRGRRERAAAERALARLLAGDPKARQELVDLGLSAWDVLEAAQKGLEGDKAGLVQETLRAIAQRSAGHRAPHRNLELLGALLEHPNAELAATAHSRLLQILPEGAEPSLAWVRANADRLTWNDHRGRYELRD